MPKVSVIVPNYNHARFLDQRITSVLQQTYQDFELLYLDDASTDNSDKVFSRYSDNPKIRAFLNTSNSGSPFKQWNKGVREAQGEYIWIAEADDYADSHLLEKLVRVLDQHPNVGLAYSQSWVADEAGQATHTMLSWTDDLDNTRWHNDFVNAGSDECGRFLIMKCTIPNASAALLRKSVYETAGYADETMKIAGDWMMWSKMLSVADIAYVAEPLNYFRRHSNSVLAKKTYGSGTQERYQVVRFICDHFMVSAQVKNIVLNSLCEDWLSNVFSFNRRLTLARIISLYHAARQLEAMPLWRIARKSAQLLSRKLRMRLLSK